MMKLINDLWFKRRDIVSKGYDEALAYIADIIPLRTFKVPSGTQCWTWSVPERWEVKEAYIEDMSGKRLLDLKDHPLHVMSYSLPIKEMVKKDDLMKHLHTQPARPDAIPYEFKYYEREWGLCIQHNRLKDFTDDRYKVYIDSRFEKGDLSVGECTIEGQSDEMIVLVAHLCHPAMVNDDLTGVAALVEICKALRNKRANRYTYKILFVPETIGSIAYLSRHEHLIPNFKYGIFLEMLGNENTLALQLSRQGDTRLDRVARYVLKNAAPSFREGAFREIVGNDEMVFNGPGVDIPMISVSRYPYPEYHTSDDNPGIISENRLREATELILKILDVIDKDYIPKRKFTGPLFLSGNGLWVDWRTNRKLNKNIEKILLRLEGNKSIFDISEDIAMEYDEVLGWVDKLERKGFVARINEMKP